MAKKVLVVEDNLLNLKLFCDLLRVHGYDARAVSDGREALAQAREFGPHLIIMDIQLPHVSGLELIGEAKADESLHAIPVMAVTAYAAGGDEERIRAAGAEAYVSKPISVLRFAEEVRALIGAAEEEIVLPGDAAGITEEEGEAVAGTAPEGDAAHIAQAAPAVPAEIEVSLPGDVAGITEDDEEPEPLPAQGREEELDPGPRRDDVPPA